MSEYPAVGAVKLSKRTIDALSVERGDKVFWDRDQPGFGIRVHATGRKIYVAQARTPGGLPKRGVIGRYVEMTTEEARRKAAGIIDRIRRGEDAIPPPPVAEPTVADLAERYMTAHVAVNCRPGTVESFGSLLRLYILPELGGLKLTEVDRSHVSALHHKLRGKPSQANQALSVLSKMFKLAMAWGMTPARPNPCRSVRRYKQRVCERFLTADEYARLGRVLFEAETEGPLMASAAAAIRLLLLNPHVIPGTRRGSRMSGLQRPWVRIRKSAGLEDMRLHDCRHSFASRALALGESLPMIGRLLGHSQVQTTARYAHLERDSVHETARRVSSRIEASLYRDCPGLAAAD